MAAEETVEYLLDSPDGLQLLTQGGYSDQDALRRRLLSIIGDS